MLSGWKVNYMNGTNLSHIMVFNLSMQISLADYHKALY